MIMLKDAIAIGAISMILTVVFYIMVYAFYALYFYFALDPLQRYIFLDRIKGGIKLRIWNMGIRLWWCRLWVRKDEFHWTLDTDAEALFYMGPQKKVAYFDDLMMRRQIAHTRSMEELFSNHVP